MYLCSKQKNPVLYYRVKNIYTVELSVYIKIIIKKIKILPKKNRK